MQHELTYYIPRILYIYVYTMYQYVPGTREDIIRLRVYASIIHGKYQQRSGICCMYLQYVGVPGEPTVPTRV